MSLYLGIWYHCCFFFSLSCYTMSKTCDHFTASGKLVWNFACVGVCMDVPVYLHFRYTYSLYCKYIYRYIYIHNAFCASRSNFIAFQGLPIILMCWNVNFPHSIPTKSNSKLKLALPWHCLGFFCFSCRQCCYGVAMIQYLYSATKILCGCCLLENSVACVCVCLCKYVCMRKIKKTEEWVTLTWALGCVWRGSKIKLSSWFMRGLFLTKWQKIEPLFLNKRIKNLRI